jgi:hypothetical protein
LPVIAPWSDFIDVHFYPNDREFVPSDITQLRTKPWWKPFLVGESGQNVGTDPGPAPSQRWLNNGQITALRGCLRTIGFSSSDFDTSSNGAEWASTHPIWLRRGRSSRTRSMRGPGAYSPPVDW